MLRGAEWPALRYVRLWTLKPLLCGAYMQCPNVVIRLARRHGIIPLLATGASRIFTLSLPGE